MAKYKQGKYKLKNPDKYIGDRENVVYRSSWEQKFMIWADKNPNVINWNSEETIFPYISPIDGKQHRYFLDFMILVRTRSGELKKYAVEVKPEAQTVPPKQTRNKKRYITECMTYAVNQAKWEAADNICKQNGITFIVLTEKHLKV